MRKLSQILELFHLIQQQIIFKDKGNCSIVNAQVVVLSVEDPTFPSKRGSGNETSTRWSYRFSFPNGLTLKKTKRICLELLLKLMSLDASATLTVCFFFLLDIQISYLPFNLTFCAQYRLPKIWCSL